MTITIFDFNETITARLSQSWEIDEKNISGPKSVSGFDQVIFGLRPTWVCKLSLLVRGNTNARSFQAFKALLRGRARGIRMFPDCCVAKSLYERLGAVANTDDIEVPFSDDAPFSDGSTWAWPIPLFSVVSNIAEGQEDGILIDTDPYLPALTDGDLIGIDGCLYRITRVTDVSGSIQTVSVMPPVRAFVLAGAKITTRPTVVMRLMNPRDGEVNIGASKMNNVELSLEEWVGQV